MASHIWLAFAPDSFPARSRSMSATCMCHVAMAVRAAAKTRMSASTWFTQDRSELEAVRGSMSGAGQSTPLRRISFIALRKAAIRCWAPTLVWFQNALASCRVMAPTTSWFIAPMCTCHWSIAGRAASSGAARIRAAS